MNLDAFVGARRDAWDELDGLAGAARGRPERLGPERVRRLGALYRAAAADLAYARRRWPGDPVVDRLEGLVVRSRALVYGSDVRRGSVVAFVTLGYWRRIAERPRFLVISALLLAAPAVAAGLWGFGDPAGAVGFVPAPYRSIVEPRAGGDLGIAAGDQAAFSALIFTNNIRVGFVAFAGGMTAGIATAMVLAFNGALLGAVAGLAASAGNGAVLVELVAPHGLLEMSCIVVAGAAGLRVGWALVDPGRAGRLEALRREAVPAVEMAVGTALWLVVAGLVEGFVTPAGIGLEAAIVIGTALAALYWALVAIRGRPRDGRVPWP